MRILTPSGARVPLSEVASYEIARGDVAINHLEGRREIRLSTDLKDPKATTATEATEMIKSEVLPQILAKYPSVTPSYEGQNREADKLLTSLNAAGIPILVMIYITIAFTFRSMTQPLLLFIMVPLSLTAVAWGHWMHGFPLNVLSILGIIALIGIMVNDGLVFIGKFNTNFKTGLKFEEALLDAGKSRFRAIFLTSATTISGLAPLIFEKSRQAQFLKPMAISIAYGIGYATLLTLIVLHILLSFNNQLKVWVSWLKSGDMPSQESVEQAILEEAEEKELIDPSDEK